MGAYSTGKSLKDIGVIGGSDITTEAAMAKLIFLLGQFSNNKEVRAHLVKNICGEISE
jgi:L-asparaginase